MSSRRIALALALAWGCGDPAGGGTRDAGHASSVDGGTDAPVADDANVDAWAPPRCGDGVVNQASEACDDGNTNAFDGCLADCTEPPVLGPPDRTWTWYPIPGTQCMDGTETGIGVSIATGSTDLMVYLEGGGACFNDACDFSALSVPFVPPPDGIFDRTQRGNPVRDWNMVYVPYCTGDIYGGDRDTILGGAVRHFHGYVNIQRDLEAIVPAFPHVTRVLWTGISAGGFGAGLNATRAADAFGAGRHFVLIDDSGPPLGNDVIPPCLQQIFRDVWGLDDTVLAACGADCPDPNDFASGVLAHFARLHPDASVGAFSNTGDSVIRTFMGFGWYDGVRDRCTGLSPTSVPFDVFQDGLVGLRTTYGARASFYLNGATGVGFGLGHTTLRTASFYTPLTGGVAVNDWVADVIEGTNVQVGP